jgi:hypothetical protein
MKQLLVHFVILSAVLALTTGCPNSKDDATDASTEASTTNSITAAPQPEDATSGPQVMVPVPTNDGNTTNLEVTDKDIKIGDEGKEKGQTLVVGTEESNCDNPSDNSEELSPNGTYEVFVCGPDENGEQQEVGKSKITTLASQPKIDAIIEKDAGYVEMILDTMGNPMDTEYRIVIESNAGTVVLNPNLGAEQQVSDQEEDGSKDWYVFDVNSSNIAVDEDDAEFIRITVPVELVSNATTIEVQARNKDGEESDVFEYTGAAETNVAADEEEFSPQGSDDQEVVAAQNPLEAAAAELVTAQTAHSDKRNEIKAVQKERKSILASIKLLNAERKKYSLYIKEIKKKRAAVSKKERPEYTKKIAAVKAERQKITEKIKPLRAQAKEKKLTIKALVKERNELRQNVKVASKEKKKQQQLARKAAKEEAKKLKAEKKAH